MIADVTFMRKLRLIDLNRLNDMTSLPDQKKYFLQIINEHQGLINSVCKMYRYHDEDFKDLRQEVILQLWKSLSGRKSLKSSL